MSETLPAVQPERVVGKDIGVSSIAGGLTFTNMAEVVDFARLMARSGIAVPKHLRENPGACLAITIQAVEWGMSPFAVANKSYSVNDRLAYESQLIQAVLLARAPIVGRLSFEYAGDGPTRTCTCFATLREGMTVRYTTPQFKDIKVKNSPLWTADPDQQMSYYAGRSLARRYFADVLLGLYTEDELRDTPVEPEALRINPLHDDVEVQATDVTASSDNVLSESSGGQGAVSVDSPDEAAPAPSKDIDPELDKAVIRRPSRARR